MVGCRRRSVVLHMQVFFSLSSFSCINTKIQAQSRKERRTEGCVRVATANSSSATFNLLLILTCLYLCVQLSPDNHRRLIESSDFISFAETCILATIRPSLCAGCTCLLFSPLCRFAHARSQSIEAREENSSQVLRTTEESLKHPDDYRGVIL